MPIATELNSVEVHALAKAVRRALTYTVPDRTDENFVHELLKQLELAGLRLVSHTSSTDIWLRAVLGEGETC